MLYLCEFFDFYAKHVCIIKYVYIPCLPSIQKTHAIPFSPLDKENITCYYIHR